MLIISAGLPRSGTGWIYNLTNDLLVAGGYLPASEVRTQFNLTEDLREHNCSLGHPGFMKLRRLTAGRLRDQKYVVKTHAGVNFAVRWHVNRGKAKATYIYRDPRDAVLSAYEEGQRMREKGVNKSFAEFPDIPTTIMAVRNWMKIWEEWTQFQPAKCFRYEDLKADPVAAAADLCRFLEIEVPQQKLTVITDNYGAGKVREGSHFRTGKTGRYKEVLTPTEIELCRQELGPYIKRMGYDWD